MLCGPKPSTVSIWCCLVGGFWRSLVLGAPISKAPRHVRGRGRSLQHVARPEPLTDQESRLDSVEVLSHSHDQACPLSLLLVRLSLYLRMYMFKCLLNVYTCNTHHLCISCVKVHTYFMYVTTYMSIPSVCDMSLIRACVRLSSMYYYSLTSRECLGLPNLS